MTCSAWSGPIWSWPGPSCARRFEVAKEEFEPGGCVKELLDGHAACGPAKPLRHAVC